MASLDDSRNRIVVIDVGSSACRTGVAGFELPNNTFSTCKWNESTNLEECSHINPCWNSRYLVNDWDAMEKTWRRAFFLSNGEPGPRLPTSSRESRASRASGAIYPPLILTVPILTPRAVVERMIKILFENLGVAALHLEPPQTLALLGVSSISEPTYHSDNQVEHSIRSQQSTGIVVDIGQFCTSVVPVYQGYPIPSSGNLTVYGIGGDDITTFMERLLETRFPAWKKSHHLGGNTPEQAHNIARAVKEKAAYVSSDFSRDMELAVDNETSFQYDFELKHQIINKGPESEKELLVNRTSVLNVATERFRCIEPLFQPALVGRAPSQCCSQSSNIKDNCAGLHSHVLCVIDDEEDGAIKVDFLRRIVLTGGTVRIPGLVERFQRELNALLQNTSSEYKEVTVLAAPDPENTVWRGGARMAANEIAMQHTLMMRNDYFDDTLIDVQDDLLAPARIKNRGISVGMKFRALESMLTLDFPSELSNASDTFDFSGQESIDTFSNIPNSLEKLSKNREVFQKATEKHQKEEKLREKRRTRFGKDLEKREIFSGAYVSGEANYFADLRWATEVDIEGP